MKDDNCQGCGAQVGETHSLSCPMSGTHEPDPAFDHLHEESIWDTYTTPDNHEIAVETRNGEVVGVHIKTRPADKTADRIVGKFSNLDEAQQVLTALHAAVANIHKRRSQ